MALNPKVKLIEDGERETQILSGEEDRMRKLYMQDGQLDATEEQALDRIQAKIGKLRTAIERIKAEVAAAKAEWEGHGAEWSEAASRLAALQEFAHPRTGEVQSAFPPIDESVADQRWEDATSGNGKLQSDLAPIWEDYERQKAAQAEYDPLRSTLDSRIASAESAQTKTADIVTQLSTLQNQFGAMDSSVTARVYVEALDLARTTDGELAKLEAEIVRVAQQKVEFDGRLAGLSANLGDAAACEYTKLKESQQAIDKLRSDAETEAAKPDYDTALPKLDELTTALDQFMVERAALDVEKQAYEQAMQALDGRLAGVTGASDASTAEAFAEVTAAKEAVDAAVQDEDFPGALTLVGELETKIAALEDLIEDRDLFRARFDALQEELQRVSVSKAEWGYLEPIQQKISSIEDEVKAAADAEDFTGALEKIAGLEAALVEFDEAIEARRAEYEAQRGQFDGMLDHFIKCAYPIAEKAGVDQAVAKIDAAVGTEDWDGAVKAVEEAQGAFEAFEKAHAAYLADLKKKISDALPDLSSVANDPASARSSTCATLKRLVGILEKQQSSSDDIEDPAPSIEEAKRCKAELTAMMEIYKKLDGVEADDATAKKIVDELKASGDLGKLSPEARNVLIEKLLDKSGGGAVTADEKNAIRDIWASTTKLDEAFTKLDAATTKKITDALANDPKLKEMAANWGTMSNADKQKAMKKIAGMVGGKDGWNIPDIDKLKLSVDGGDCTSKPGLRGWHQGAYGSNPEEISICMCNNYTLPDGSKWNPKDDMKDVIMNLSHEVGHGYQEDMMKRLKNGKIKPGDPEYEQAKALTLDRQYFKEYPDDYSDDKRAYIHSPMEQQSRQTANRMRGDLPADYGEGYLQETTHPGP